MLCAAKHIKRHMKDKDDENLGESNLIQATLERGSAFIQKRGIKSLQCAAHNERYAGNTQQRDTVRAVSRRAPKNKRWTHYQQKKYKKDGTELRVRMTFFQAKYFFNAARVCILYRVDRAAQKVEFRDLHRPHYFVPTPKHHPIQKHFLWKKTKVVLSNSKFKILDSRQKWRTRPPHQINGNKENLHQYRVHYNVRSRKKNRQERLKTLKVLDRNSNYNSGLQEQLVFHENKLGTA